jgi:hypothetical protein
MKNQTAVQYIREKMQKDFEVNTRIRLAYLMQVLREAEQIEKQRILDAHLDGAINWDSTCDDPAEFYYQTNFNRG